MSVFSIDLCVGWVRVAECVDGVFDGVIRNLALGEWRLTGAVDAISFEGSYTLEDVDTIRIVRDDEIVFAGFVAPVTSGVGGLESVHDDGGEQFSLTGPDAWDVLTSRFTYPTPSTGQPWADSHDIRTGVASTVVAEYISANAGVSATADRQIPGLTVVDGLAGMSGTWSARFQPLDQLVARVCQDGGIVCRLVVSFAGALTATLGNPRDRRTTTVLSDQGDLSKIQSIVTPETTTFVVAGGQGDLTDRTFAEAGTATGAARRELFLNQTSLASVVEVQQSADTALALAGSTLTVRAEVTDDAAERLVYLEDYEVGDTISAEIGFIRYPVVVESVTIHVSLERSVIRPVLGDAAPDLVTGLLRDVAGLQSRFDPGDGGAQGSDGPAGEQGIQGLTGSTGAAGPGVAAGGATGSLLNKASGSDYDTAWVTRATLAADAAFTSVYMKGTSGAGAPGGSGTQGEWYWDTTNKREYLSDGTGWIIMSEAFQTDGSPALANVTIGDGTWTTARYHRSDGWCEIEYVFTLGSTSAVTGLITINLPIAASLMTIGRLNVIFIDSGSVYPGVNGSSVTDPALLAYNSAGTYLAGAATSATIPFAWGNADQIIVTGRYPMTTRYS